MAQEGIRGNDTADVSESHLPGSTNGSTMVTSEIHIEPADDDGHGRVGTHRDEEECSILKISVMVDGDQDGEASNGHADGDDAKEEAMLELVREEGDDHCKAKGARPRRDTMQLGLNRAVTVGCDDGRREEGVAIGRDDQAEIHEAANKDLVVLEDSANISEGNLAVRSGTALVNLQSGLDVRSLLRSKPFGILGERGKHEEEKDCHDASEAALKDEDPAPASVVSHVVHLANGGGQETSKGARKRCRAEEERVSLLSFSALIPHTDQVECAREHSGFE